MRLRSLIVLVGIAFLFVLSSFPALTVAKARRFSSVWFEPFNGPEAYQDFDGPLDVKWNSYRGSPRIDSNLGKSGSSMFFDHPSIFGDEASFGSQDSCSAFISDPDLRSFENGIIEFDMYFDNDAGQKAFVIFRMENDQSYYAARITSTHNWQGYFVRRTGANDWYAFGSKSYFWAVAPQVWFHVVIVIDGNHFELWRDMERLFSGDDWSLPRGKWGGIGFYCAY
jgi:hypothetical protein